MSVTDEIAAERKRQIRAAHAEGQPEVKGRA